MIKKLKYSLSKIFKDRRVRIGGIALITAFTFTAVTFLGCPIRTVKNINGDLYHIDFAYAGLEARVSAAKIVKITPTEQEKKTFPVYITCADQTVTVDFEANGTVVDALALAGYTADQDDFVEPALDTVITTTAYIDFAKVDYVNGSYEQSIPYSTEVVYSAEYDKGYSELTTAGTNGTELISYTEKLVNGVSQEKTVTNTQTVKAPTSAVKVVGTKVKVVKTSESVNSISTLKAPFSIELDENGNPVNYKSKRVARATAYTYTGNNCSTGVAPQPGYIAVNPNVIPYGTKMYIKSADGSVVYGYAVAADTGGFIRRFPTGVDLFMSTESACRQFGVQNMEIYILE